MRLLCLDEVKRWAVKASVGKAEAAEAVEAVEAVVCSDRCRV